MNGNSKLDFVLSVMIILFIISCSLFTDVYGVKVDIYQYTGFGTPGDMLTPTIMNASSIGGFGSVPATWRVNSSGDGMHVSSNYARPLPGTVTVGTMTYSGMGGSRSWVTRTDIDQSFVWGEFNPSLLHSSMTVACFFTTEPRTGAASSDFALDIINVGYPVQESDTKATYSVIQMHLHNADPMKLRTHGFTGISSPGPGIDIEARKTYWINLHHDGPNGKQRIAIYDPDNNYAPVGAGIEINDTKVNPIEGFVKIGRVDSHGYTGSPYWLYDGVADTNGQSHTYFSHIMVDFTEAKFPLLPDIGPSATKPPSDKSPASKLSTIVNLITCPNPCQNRLLVKYDSHCLLSGIKIVSMDGEEVASLPGVKSNQITINTSHIHNGEYWLYVKAGMHLYNRKICILK